MDKNNKTDTKKKAMIKALEKSLGIVTSACQSVGIHRSTHYDWIQADEEYRNAVEQISDIALDFAESKLHDNIKKEKETSIIFYLKTKGKARGYVERQEHSVAVGKNAEFPDWMNDE